MTIYFYYRTYLEVSLIRYISLVLKYPSRRSHENSVDRELQTGTFKVRLRPRASKLELRLSIVRRPPRSVQCDSHVSELCCANKAPSTILIIDWYYCSARSRPTCCDACR